MARLFRVENPDTMKGLWYDGAGNFTEYVKTLDDGHCRDLPMPYNPEIAGGWFSACDNTVDMRNWFSGADLQQLQQRGYHLYEVHVPDMDCRSVDGHIVFRRENADFRRLSLALLTEDWCGDIFDALVGAMGGVGVASQKAVDGLVRLYNDIMRLPMRKQLIHKGKKPRR